MKLNTTEEILEDIRVGRMVVIMDDEDRENEGDLVMAASLVRPEDVNFMARFGRGLICLTLARERCAQLRLPLMVSETDRDQRTNFTKRPRVSPPVSRHTTARTRCAPRYARMRAPRICASLVTFFQSWPSPVAC